MSIKIDLDAIHRRLLRLPDLTLAAVASACPFAGVLTLAAATAPLTAGLRAATWVVILVAALALGIAAARVVDRRQIDRAWLRMQVQCARWAAQQEARGRADRDGNEHR